LNQGESAWKKKEKLLPGKQQHLYEARWGGTSKRDSRGEEEDRREAGFHSLFRWGNGTQYAGAGFYAYAERKNKYHHLLRDFFLPA